MRGPTSVRVEEDENSRVEGGGRTTQMDEDRTALCEPIGRLGRVRPKRLGRRAGAYHWPNWINKHKEHPKRYWH